MLITIGFLAAIAGFCVALYIYRKQGAKKPLMCPRRAPCETVLASPQAKTLGISNAVLGMAYYLAILLLLVLTLKLGARLLTPLTVLTATGFAFSLYLVGVQHFKIRQWCVWCLGSALMATVLFAVALFLH